MATKGRIQVIATTKAGEFIVQGVDTASMQILAEAIGRAEGLKIEKAWPRRRGGADYPKLKLTKDHP